MARRKKNIWQQLRDQPSYDRDAGRVLYGEHDVERWFVEPEQDEKGNLVFGEYMSEPVVDPILKRWIDALLMFDDRKHHDAAPLIALLESDVEMLPIVFIWLADLVKRYGIKCHVEQRQALACVLNGFKLPPPTSGRPLVPAYDMSDRDVELRISNDKVSELRKKNGGTVEANIVTVAREKFPRDPEQQSRFANTLRLFRKGKHTSARRAAKRRT
jgi:hypothetical protein